MRTVLLAVLTAGALTALASLGLWSYRQRVAAHAAALARGEEPRSLLKMLTTDDQLQDAAQRAAIFERGVAARANGRATLYEALAAERQHGEPPATVHSLSGGQSDDERRSA